MVHVAVLGAGSWGTTFAKVLADGGNTVTLWARRPEVAEEIHNTNRNTSYLPGIALPKTIDATDNLAQALAGAEQVYLAVPSQHLRANLADAASLIPADVPVVSLMKGVEAQTGLRMSSAPGRRLCPRPDRSGQRT
jgi:glycerol-3-phosphate dehydrogenase (NAD(P)+)